MVFLWRLDGVSEVSLHLLRTWMKVFREDPPLAWHRIFYKEYVQFRNKFKDPEK